jgi:hypothetical protein
MRTEVALPGDFTLAHVDAILLELAGNRRGSARMPYLAVGGRRRVAGELMPRSVHLYRRLGTAQALAERLELIPDMASYMHGDQVVDFWWDESRQARLVLVGEPGPVVDALRRIRGDAAPAAGASDGAARAAAARGVEKTVTPAPVRRPAASKAPSAAAPATRSGAGTASTGSSAQPGGRSRRPAPSRPQAAVTQSGDATARQRAEKAVDSRDIKRFVTSVSAAVVAGIILRALGL